VVSFECLLVSFAFVVISEMDEREIKTQLLQTERAESLTVTTGKPVLDENWQDVKALLDNSHETEPVCEGVNSNSKEMVIENSGNVEILTSAADGLMHSDANYIPYHAEDNSFAADNVAQVLSPSAANGNESLAIECMEATTEQDTSSFIVINSTEEAVANTPEKKDLHDVSGNQHGYVTSVPASSTNPSDVSDLETSVVEANSQHYSEELTEDGELSVTGSSQPESSKY